MSNEVGSLVDPTSDSLYYVSNDNLIFIFVIIGFLTLRTFVYAIIILLCSGERARIIES